MSAQKKEKKKKEKKRKKKKGTPLLHCRNYKAFKRNAQKKHRSLLP
jgi:hypothetical protein